MEISIMPPTTSNAITKPISTMVHFRMDFMEWCFTNAKIRNAPRDIPIEYAINSINPNGVA